MNWRYELPGYRELAENERFVRDASFLDVPQEICGIPVKALTPRLLNILEMAGNYFVGRGPLNEVSEAQFLWVVAPQFQPNRKLLTALKKRLYLRSFPKENADKIGEGISEYLKVTFQDAPHSDGENERVQRVSMYAGIVDNLAKEYGWDDEAILDKPFTRIFQYMRQIEKRYDSKAKHCNESDKIVSEWLDQLNAQQSQ